MAVDEDEFTRTQNNTSVHLKNNTSEIITLVVLCSTQFINCILFSFVVNYSCAISHRSPSFEPMAQQDT